MNGWLPVVASTVALAITAGVPLVATLRSLKANRPVTEATADEKQAAANASSFNAQQGVINMLNAQLDRQNLQIGRQEERIAALERRDEQRDRQTVSLRKNLQLMSDWMRDHFATAHPGEHPPELFLSKRSEHEHTE